MKNILIMILSFSLLSLVFGQNDATRIADQEVKENTLSFSVLWGAFGLIHANYGKVMDEGKKEYQLMFGTFGYDSDFSEAEEEEGFIDGNLYGIKGASGIKLSYRKYRKEGAKGLFYQAHMRLLNYSWGYKLEGESWKDVNTFAYQPALVLGYKYHPPVLNKRLFIEAFAGGGYSYDNPEDGDVKLMFYDEENPESGETAGSNDFGPEFNLFLGFTF